MKDGNACGDYVPITKGSPRFRIRSSGDFQVTSAWFPPGAFLDRHAHDRRVFAVMLRGSFDLVFGGREYDCTPSTVFTEPGGESHANAIGSAGADVIVIQPGNEAELGDLCDRMLDRPNHFRCGAIAALACRLQLELREPDEVSDLAIQSLALEMLVTATRRSTTERSPGAPPSWFGRVEEMVHDRFTERLRLSELAEEAGVHPSHVTRVFRQHYGVSVGEFVRNLRLEWATTRLVSTDQSISSIALQAGFADQSHFTRAFRRAKGSPPGSFRNSRRGTGER